ncbi:Cyclic dehypoxanthine futalosine synthase [Chlamydia avium]|uniref:Cyclic dehypoxanthine futalosine synthase n=1 Tax=Chlamydia avium TaxID=1457141 RepID=A0ABP2X7J3_9CHLA|nr:cyclic dehypoxanthinyl futalosine synthase [Chlamydia avium]EPP37019.1 menaquinone biosynthesis protein, SCO4550 family [Chlamydia psittaci 10_743_SC13]EPP38813.1 menaquinone biosynthesis protein, SCO4550 family [Chlamydia avium]VVT43080.1 Cyclic dehypoxanthine futalosine synthase [Chlamydia avium]
MCAFPRISFNEGLELFRKSPLKDLQEIANSIRKQRYPDDRVTYVLDANPNYTNICKIDCSFCAFYRKPHSPDAYLLSFQEFSSLLHRYVGLGVKTVLLQGGVHPKIGIDYLEELVKITVRDFPQIHPHFFSAVEISHAARVSGISDEEALIRLWDAGQRTIPGGGAEILSEKVRKVISPKKMGPNGWIQFHKLAHHLGFRTTATMMFGHIETAEDILIHLDTLRQAQDENPGFYSFIPWSYKPGNTALGRKISHFAPPEMYYRILALSRIFLDNFDHIAASWFGEGKENGVRGLHYGADDFGGTIIDESVHKCTGWTIQSSEKEIRELITSEGFIPMERNTFYTTPSHPCKK